jgi:cytochrome b6-f complex iron-sulfur subunit
MIETNKTSAGATPPDEGVATMTRRRFLTVLFAGATAVGLGAFAAPLARYAYPVLKGQVFEKQKITTTALLTAEGVRFDYMDTPAQLIQLEDKSYAAYSLVCTHLGCIVKWEAAKRDFHCPCHAGKFNELGQPIAGPPPTPLTAYKVAVEGADIFVEGLA